MVWPFSHHDLEFVGFGNLVFLELHNTILNKIWVLFPHLLKLGVLNSLSFLWCKGSLDYCDPPYRVGWLWGFLHWIGSIIIRKCMRRRTNFLFLVVPMTLVIKSTLLAILLVPAGRICSCTCLGENFSSQLQHNPVPLLACNSVGDNLLTGKNCWGFGSWYWIAERIHGLGIWIYYSIIFLEAFHIHIFVFLKFC